MTMIQDGTGTGDMVKITSDNRMDSSCRTEDRMYYASRDTGLAFFYYSDVTPTGTGDVCCYIKNTHATKNIIVKWIRAYCASVDALDIYLGQAGTPSGGTDITPVNLNQTSGNTATGTFQEGANITALTGGSKLDRIRLEAGKDAFTDFDGLILGISDTLSLHVLTGANVVEITIGFYYE